MVKMVNKNLGLTPPSETCNQFDMSVPAPYAKKVSKSPGWGHFYTDVFITPD